MHAWLLPVLCFKEAPQRLLSLMPVAHDIRMDKAVSIVYELRGVYRLQQSADTCTTLVVSIYV